MPPASLPAFAAISPGPMTARKRKKRGNRRANGDSRQGVLAGGASCSCSVPARTSEMTIAHLYASAPAKRAAAPPSPRFVQQAVQHVIDGDRAQEAPVLVDDRDRKEIIFADLLGDLLRLIVGGDGHRVLRHYVAHR